MCTPCSPAPPDAGVTQRNPEPLASTSGTMERLDKDVHENECDNYEDMAPENAIYEVPDYI